MKVHEITRDTDGNLPSHAWPGAYPIIYITADGLTVCAKCANEPDTSDPVTDFDIYWEGPVLTCEDGGERIESAYGDPDAERTAADVIELATMPDAELLPLLPDLLAAPEQPTESEQVRALLRDIAEQDAIDQQQAAARRANEERNRAECACGLRSIERADGTIWEAHEAGCPALDATTDTLREEQAEQRADDREALSDVAEAAMERAWVRGEWDPPADVEGDATFRREERRLRDYDDGIIHDDDH